MKRWRSWSLLLVVALSACHPVAVRTVGSPEKGPQGDVQTIRVPTPEEIIAIDRVVECISGGIWSAAHEGVLGIDRSLWGLIEKLSDPGLQYGGSLADRLRDRTWQHLQDRLSAVDGPGLADEQAVLISCALALSARCAAASQELPRGFSDAVTSWQGRLERRWRSDQHLTDVAAREAGGDLLGAWQSMEQACRACPDDQQLTRRSKELLGRLATETISTFEAAARAGNPGALLPPLRLLVRLGISPPAIPQFPVGAPGWRQWCERKLEEEAASDIARDLNGKALLTLVRLVDLGVSGAGQRIEIVRSRQRRIPLPRLTGSFVTPSGELLLVEFDPVFEQIDNVRLPAPGASVMAIGRTWHTRPSHAADVQRWGRCLEEYLAHFQSWLEAPAVKAEHIRQRQRFQLRRLMRLAGRIEKTEARRWKTLWSATATDGPTANGVRIRGSQKLLLVHPGGDQRLISIVEEAIIQPLRNPEGISREQHDVCRQRLRWRLAARVEALTEELEREQLRIALGESRRSARGGEGDKAIDLLVSTLLTAQPDRDGALIDEGVDLLGLWTGLEEARIRRALGLFSIDS